MTASGWDTKGWIEVADRLKLDVPPVAVGFHMTPPAGISRLEGRSSLCEMITKAYEGSAFYAGPENHMCEAGLFLIGKDVPSVYESGEFGAGLQVFDHSRAMRRLYDVVPRLDPARKISYVTFSPLAGLAFEPDLLVIATEVEQAEVLLRALSYTTGKVWTSKTTSVIGCAWVYIYPYLTGELNYVTTGLSHGMRRRKVFPPGKQLISIPYDLFATMLRSLQSMPWVLPLFRPDAEEFRENLMAKLGIDASRYVVE